MSWFETNFWWDLPRWLMAFISGSLWAQAGLLLQWTTKNPLACPTTLGLTAPALSCWLMVLLFDLMLGSHWIDHGLFPLIAMPLCVVALNLFHYYCPPQGLWGSGQQRYQTLLSGLTLNLLLTSLYTLVQFMALSQGKAVSAALWLGQLKYVSWYQASLGMLLLSVLWWQIPQLLKQLAPMALGRGSTLSMIAPRDYHRGLERAFFWSGLSCCGAILLGGYFSYWGLLIPHIVRKLTAKKGDLRAQWVYSTLLGGFGLLGLDLAVYWITWNGSELPVGALSAVLGPILLLVLLRQ